MKLSEIGEFGLIQRFSAPFLKNLPPGTRGIGDDCAILPWKKDSALLVTTDMLVENVHFLRAGILPEDLGWKSLAVNLSDIAAMGGNSHSAFLSLGLPLDIAVGWIDRFFKGLRGLAAKEKVRLLGGDTTRSEKAVIINVAVLGSVDRRRAKLRSAARPGDVVCVTGCLGDSAAGLKIILAGHPAATDETRLTRRHNRPRPHLAEGAWLARQKGVRAMMDVSDGIDSDIRRIMESSRCGAAIDIGLLPLSAELRRVSKKFGWKAASLAASGGEDYCLLLTVDPSGLHAVREGFSRTFGRPLHVIGHILPRAQGLVYTEGGKAARLQARGYDHFARTGK